MRLGNSKIQGCRSAPERSDNNHRRHLSSPASRGQGRHRVHARAHLSKPRAAGAGGWPVLESGRRRLLRRRIARRAQADPRLAAEVNDASKR